MTKTSTLAIVLAAGQGTRMKSSLPKVLHRLAGAPMLAHVLTAVKAAEIDRSCVVVAPGMDMVTEAAKAIDPDVATFVQAKQLGTADAVKSAANAFAGFKGPVLILYGDTPLLQVETLNLIRKEL